MEAHFVALQEEEVTLLRYSRNESHFEKKNHGFIRFLGLILIFTKGKYSRSSAEQVLHVDVDMYTTVDLPAGLSAVHSLYSLMNSNTGVSNWVANHSPLGLPCAVTVCVSEFL